MNQERLMTVLLEPHVSEKATLATEKANQVVFKVRRDATKAEIGKAVELMFEVKVEKVQVSLTKGKAKRFGQMHGRRSDWKKAYVRLAAGQTIDFLGGD
jgi:large subunit ribosomal protein L23